MNRFRRFLGLGLALTMALSLCVTPSWAAARSMDNFTRQNTYTDRTFSDVRQEQWSYSAIKTCYEYALMQGSGGETFDAKGSLSVAQALTMADRVHEIYETGESTLTNGTGRWFNTYVDYAVRNGIIGASDFSDYTAPISRADMALIFSRALPEAELAAVKTVEIIPDMDDAPARDRDAIWALYRAGVLTGSDAYGTFKPNSGITRQEAAAIIARVAIPDQRRTGPILQQVTDGIFTFGLPQGGAVSSSTTSTGSRMHVVENTGVAVDIYASENSVFAGQSLVKMITPAEEKGLLEDKSGEAWLSNCVVTRAAFGSVQAYRSTGEYASDTFSFPMLTYRFISGSILYRVSVTWNEQVADSALVQAVCGSLTVNGNPADPAFSL